MKKIIVIGCPGSGKSTFSRKLHQATGISLFHLDMMYWNSDQTTVDKAVFMERLQNVLQRESWIVDGNYASSMEMRMQACDTVFFLDYPVDVCLAGIRERRGKIRMDMPWVETEEDAGFIDFVTNYNRQNRPEVMKLLDQYSSKVIYIFAARDEADAFLAQIR